MIIDCPYSNLHLLTSLLYQNHKGERAPQGIGWGDKKLNKMTNVLIKGILIMFVFL